ncbi:MAG: hypothetical protein ABR505_12105 [Actinomycetota bacterium]
MAGVLISLSRHPDRFFWPVLVLGELAAVGRKKDKRLAHEETRKWKKLNRDARARARLR